VEATPPNAEISLEGPLGPEPVVDLVVRVVVRTGVEESTGDALGSREELVVVRGVDAEAGAVLQVGLDPSASVPALDEPVRVVLEVSHIAPKVHLPDPGDGRGPRAHPSSEAAVAESAAAHEAQL